MSTAPSGNDPSAVYSTSTLVGRWIPDEVITTTVDGSGASAVKGKVSAGDITDLIRSKSRTLDGELWAAGFRSPFPDIAATGPRVPEKVRDVVTYRVAADIRAIAHIGNREAPGVEDLETRAQEIVDALVEKPHSMGKVAVTTPEDFTLQAFTGSREAGYMMGIWYRLKNRDIERHTLRFVNSAGKEVGRTESIPFLSGADWQWIDPAEGIIAVVNTQVTSQIGTGGGVVYTFGWVRLDRFRTRMPTLAGVMR